MLQLVEDFFQNLQPKTKKIFFVHQGQRSFFDRDIKILKEIAQVESFDNFPPSLQKIAPIIRGVSASDLVYIWFMGRHAVLPLIAAKICPNAFFHSRSDARLSAFADASAAAAGAGRYPRHLLLLGIDRPGYAGGVASPAGGRGATRDSDSRRERY